MIVLKVSEYLANCPTLKAKILAIEGIQAALLDQVLATITSGNELSQYSLNDGQTIISASYKNSSEVMSDYRKYEDLKNFLRNQKIGSMVRLVDSKSFPYGW